MFLVGVLTLLGLAFFVHRGVGQKRPDSGKRAAAKQAPIASAIPVVGRAVAFAETRPLRDLIADLPQNEVERKEEQEEMNPMNTGDFAKADPNAPEQTDGALQTSFGPDGHFKINIPAPILTFEGVGVNGGSPPDTNGAVGPNDYVQTVNVRAQIFSKAGVPRGPSFLLSTLLQPLGGVCAGNDNGDPIAVYDRIANRWVLTQFAFSSSTTPPYHQCVAVSKTSDPTGAYWAYDFITPGNEFPDYGKMGAWSDAYYFSDRQFTNGAAYNGFGVFAFDRAKMLVGDPTASYIYFNAGPNLSNSSSGMIPTDYYGLTPPPAGAPNVFSVYIDDSSGDAQDALRLFNFHADFATPANSTFLERPESPLLVAAFDSRNPGGRADIEEPAPATAADYVDSIGDRLMLRLQYFNRAGTETLTTCHTVNAGVLPAPGLNPTVAEYKAATRHYVLQKTSPAGPYTVLDQGTFSPDANERWMGSTAVDNAGNLAVGYSISSASVFPSIAYAGRLATDPPNVLSGEQTMFAGTGSQLVTGNRWGDYSSMSLDPTDDATFWFTTEYYAASGASLWRTRIGAFKFAGTVAPPQGTLSGTITACDTGALLSDALVQVSGGPSTGFSSATLPNGTYSMRLTPGTYSVTVSDPAHNCTAIGPFSVTITNGGTTTLNQCLSGAAAFLFQSSAISVTGGNGNGIIERNECNNINVSILNNGCLLGQNVSATLSSSTPGVTITQPNSPYPNINENTAGTNSVPFAVSTSNSFVCGTAINFVLTVNFTGGTSSFPLSLNTCQAPPVALTGALTGADPQQEGRLGRNFASSCGAPKACPGSFGTGPRIYRTHTLTNGPGATCVSVQTVPGCSAATNPILTVAYLNAYVPPTVGNTGTICTNYLGDSATVGTGNTFSFDLPANGTLVLVVEEANAGTAGCSGYTLNVSGLVADTAGSAPCAPAPSAVSRKAHGGAGPFDIALPLSGPVGIEDRSGNGGVAGSHTIVLTYSTPPVGVTASIVANNPSGATGMVTGAVQSGNDLIVGLSGVTDKQVLTLSTSGGSVSPAVVSIGFLVGDVNGSRAVSSTDTAQTKAATSPGTVSLSNFRTDVNANGSINGSDVATVKASSGNTLP
ncbi:MAG: dockerin type I domain-containing protein [Gemmatimonadaceae bacterium]